MFKEQAAETRSDNVTFVLNGFPVSKKTIEPGLAGQVRTIDRGVPRGHGGLRPRDRTRSPRRRDESKFLSLSKWEIQSPVVSGFAICMNYQLVESEIVSIFDKSKAELAKDPKSGLITGVAGFIGSNLLEALLELDQPVMGMDNFITGYPHNLEDVKRTVGPEKWGKFEFIQGDIRSSEDCRRACSGVDYVLHQAAIGSVPRSIDDPITTNACNVDGFLQMLVAAGMEARVKRFVFRKFILCLWRQREAAQGGRAKLDRRSPLMRLQN